MKVAITGGSGKLGKWVVRHFLDQGYDVRNIDQRFPEYVEGRDLYVDLGNLGEVYGALEGCDAVVHTAAIPVAYRYPNEVTFSNNTLSTYNVLEAASSLGIEKAVISSSESSYGLVFSVNPFEPRYVPMDEDHPQLVQDSYGLSKIVNEETADMFHRKTGIQVVSFRLGNVIDPEGYKQFPSWLHDPQQRAQILWSYIDARDAATAMELAIQADGLGSIALNLANDETSMDIPSAELMREAYPDVEIREELGEYQTVLDNRRAKETLGWQLAHRWRDEVGS